MNQVQPAAIADDAFASCADTVARTARELAALGWAPATSGNFSMRVGAAQVAITISGRDKRNVGRDDIMLIDLDGQPVNNSARPSAETALHTQLYRRFADVTAVLHTHSPAQSVASRLFAADGAVRLQGWELQKALRGHTTHTDVLEIPVFPNTQHMPELAARVDAWLDAGKPLQAYLIDGHGLYTWGQDMPEARRHLDALEFLLGCELDLRRLQGS
ncbi:MAG TPA: methylthioribulose 1-phosphate dehydratase [Rhodanobacter sp.]|nr:methylthioribulose 1-phosphate dehydratase [Rhodanobacter sp.]